MQSRKGDSHYLYFSQKWCLGHYLSLGPGARCKIFFSDLAFGGILQKVCSAVHQMVIFSLKEDARLHPVLIYAKSVYPANRCYKATLASENKGNVCKTIRIQMGNKYISHMLYTGCFFS